METILNFAEMLQNSQNSQGQQVAETIFNHYTSSLVDSILSNKKYVELFNEYKWQFFYEFYIKVVKSRSFTGYPLALKALYKYVLVILLIFFFKTSLLIFDITF